MVGEIGEAPATGLGKLIQDERFAVPSHQRDYSWSTDEVSLLLDDVEAAKARGDRQYFVGLMVFMPGDNNEQIVLDGQQRLASAVIFFSAVRNWLRQYGDFEKDANQIQDWFIGRSELGERELRPRLILNSANHQTFLDYIVKPVPIGDIRAAHERLKRYDRNRRLMEAAIYCHDRISALSERNTPEKTAALLIGIVIYLRDAVGVVRLNVSNEDTAFTIFETLNDRGIELSPLDLVKNFLFRQASAHSTARLRDMEDRWTQMMSELATVKRDSFLKAFWTSRYGRVQATNLYKLFKAKYARPEDALLASTDLLQVAEQYAALEQADDSVWSPYSAKARETIRSLKLLGAQQTHPVLRAALATFEPREMERLLWLLEVIIVRYQFIGGGRTGRLEIACARLAEAIFAGTITDSNGTRQVATATDVFREATEIYPSDENFEREFTFAQERNNQKALYVLRAIERELRRRAASSRAAENEPGALTVEHILPRNPGVEWQILVQADPTLIEDGIYRFGNMCLLVGAGNRGLGRGAYDEKKLAYHITTIEITKTIPTDHPTWDRTAIETRQARMARLASAVWRFQ